MTFHVFITTPRAGLSFAVAPYTVEAKEVFASRGQADAFAAAKVLSAGVIALFDAMPSFHPAWGTLNAVYGLGQYVAHIGKTWKCAVGHTYFGDPSWAPGGAANLWTLVPNPGSGPWVSGAAYPAGSKCTYGGNAYSIVIPHTSQSDWTPPVVPNLWALLGPASVVAPYALARWDVVSSDDPDYVQVNRAKET